MKTIKLPTIELSSVLLRTVQKNDYRDFFELGKDEETTKFLTWGPFTRLKDAKNMLKYVYFKRMQRNEPIGYAIVDKKSLKMIGTIDYHSFDRKRNLCEIGYVLNKDFWRQGIMTEVLGSVTRTGFELLLLDKIIIKHLRENLGSKQVIIKNGYQLVNIFEKQHYHYKTHEHYDVFVYEKTANSKNTEV